MKKVLLLLPVIVLFLQCKEKDSIKIGFCADNLITERWKQDRDLFIEKSEELGAEVLTTIANGDSKLQIQQAQDLINQGVKCLVVIPVGQKAVLDIIDIAHDKGVKVISYDRLMKNCDLDFHISFDHVKVGKIQAEYMLDKKPEGNYVIIGGAITDNNAFMIRAGQKSILQSHIEQGKIHIIADEFTESWFEEEGYEVMMKSLEKANDSIDAVLAGNDALALGAIRAIEEKGLNLQKIPVTGMDGAKMACEKIVEGKLYMTVYKPIRSIAHEAARIAFSFARGEKLKPEFEDIVMIHNGLKNVPSILLPSLALTKENVKLVYPD